MALTATLSMVTEVKEQLSVFHSVHEKKFHTLVYYAGFTTFLARNKRISLDERYSPGPFLNDQLSFLKSEISAYAFLTALQGKAKRH